MAKDHCTLSPEGTWASCCQIHDFNYSKMSMVNRKKADILLYECISKRSKVVASVYFAFVRTFGWYFYEGDM